MSKPSKVISFFNGLNEDEKLEMANLLQCTAFDGSTLIVSKFQYKEIDLNTFEGQAVAEQMGYTLKFGMTNAGEDEDGFVIFSPMLLLTKGEEKVKIVGIRKAEVPIQNLTAGKGRLSLVEKSEIWAMKDSGLSIAQIAEAQGRKQETVFKVLNEDRPVKA